VQLLRRVWWQQYYASPPGEPMRWREDADVPSAALLVHSPYEPEARYCIKRQTLWVGYKVHLTETCDAEDLTSDHARRDDAGNHSG
jgi:transposase